jgi:hypothetical protein
MVRRFHMQSARLSKKDPIGGKGGIQNRWVCRTAESFARDRVGIVAKAAKIHHKFNREVGRQA